MIQHGLLFIWIDLMTLGRKERNKTYTYLNTVWDGSTFKKPLNIDDSVGSNGTMESAHTLESNDATQKQHTIEKLLKTLFINCKNGDLQLRHSLYF